MANPISPYSFHPGAQPLVPSWQQGIEEAFCCRYFMGKLIVALCQVPDQEANAAFELIRNKDALTEQALLQMTTLAPYWMSEGRQFSPKWLSALEDRLTHLHMWYVNLVLAHCVGEYTLGDTLNRALQLTEQHALPFTNPVSQSTYLFLFELAERQQREECELLPTFRETLDQLL